MVNLALNSTTARTASQKALQRRADDANARLVHVHEVIINNPTAHEVEKVEDLEDYATFSEAYARGDIAIPTTAATPRTTRTALGTRAGAITPPATSNPADLTRISELERALADLNTKVGNSGHMLTSSGKIDAGATVKSILDVFDKLNATPPVPVDAVPKSDVAAGLKKIKAAMAKLKANVLKGGRIEGLDNLKTEVANMEKLAPSAPATP